MHTDLIFENISPLLLNSPFTIKILHRMITGREKRVQNPFSADLKKIANLRRPFASNQLNRFQRSR